MADYWIKLYHEILDDPKMATLPDRLWRRTVEIFLLAGRLSKGTGILPETKQIAWSLRIPTDELQADLNQLVNTGIIEPIPNGWLVVKFKERQEKMTATERSKKYREMQQKEQYYCNETETNLQRECNANATQMQQNVAQITDNRLQITDTDNRSDTDISSGGGKSTTQNIFSIYEHEIGPLTPIIGDELKAAEQEYPPDWIILALQTASRNNKRSWAYAHAILKRWKVEGFQSVNKHDKSPGGNGRKSTLDKSLDAIKEFMEVEDGKQN